MKYSKSIFALSAVAFISLCEASYAESSEKIIEGFQGVKALQANEKVCKDKCTGDGVVEDGSCRELQTYMACQFACKPEYIVECQKTAEKQKDYNLVTACKEKYTIPKYKEEN